MHPTMTMALAGEVERDRRRDRHASQLRSLVRANHVHSVEGSRPAGGLARRLRAGVRLRPRLS